MDVQHQIYYNRHKALGPGNNVDQIISVLQNSKMKPSARYPICEEEFPSADKPWQIVLASDKLLEWGAKYGREIIGMDSRWKNTDIRCPLTILTATCRGQRVFPTST